MFGVCVLIIIQLANVSSISLHISSHGHVYIYLQAMKLMRRKFKLAYLMMI